MKGPKAAAATTNADNTHVVKIHNEHDKMRFFPRLLFVKTNKMDHKLRVALSRAGVCLHQENWDTGDNEIVAHREEALGPTWLMHLANRWEQWADRSPVSLASCLPRTGITKITLLQKE